MFKKIQDHPNYCVSDDGFVYRITKDGYKKVNGNSYSGYMIVKLDGKNFYVHKLVASAFVQGEMPGLVAFHVDGNNLNNKASNLVWASQSQIQMYRNYTPEAKRRIFGHW